MYTRSRSIIGTTLQFEKHVVTLFEGDIVMNLKYRNDSDVITIDKARVRMIHAAVSANRTMPAHCPPDPYVHKYIKPVQIVFDISDKNDAEFLKLNCSDIIDIESVNGETDPEVIIDHIFSDTPGMIEVENNVYLFHTKNGSIMDIDVFDQIIQIPGFMDMTVHISGEDGKITIVYSQCTDITEFKTEIDQFIPRKLEDPIVDIVIHILLQ